MASTRDRRVWANHKDVARYDSPVTDETRQTAAYRRGRRDLHGVLEDLITRAQRLSEARYLRAQRGTLIEEARRLRAQSIDVVTYAVLSERAAGASWTDVAAALSLDETFVVEHYEPIERQWRGGGGIGPLVKRADADPHHLRVV